LTDLPLDRDQTVRRALYQAMPDTITGLVPALGFAAASTLVRAAGGGDDSVLTDLTIRIGRARLTPFEGSDGGYDHEQDDGLQGLLRFSVAPHTFPAYTLSQLLDSMPRAEWRGRLIIIGPIDETAGDVYRLPVDVQGDPANGRTPGMLVHALIASQVIRMALGETRPLATASKWIAWLLAPLLTGVSVLIVARWLAPLRLAVVLMGGTVLLLVVAFLGIIAGVWIPVAGAIWASLTVSGLAAAAVGARLVRRYGDEGT
jgi:adenylate cyclase